jgi:hypothetical protein
MANRTATRPVSAPTGRSSSRRGLFFVLVVIGLAVLIAVPLASSDLPYRLTGEDDPIEGLKGLGALALLWLTQPPVNTAPFTPMRHIDVNPYGMNTFLQLEAEEANVERQLALLHAAGFGWIRQSFPWEDIEVQGKGDFEDRRTEPHKSAWLKYDRIVDLAAAHDIRILARLDNPPAWSREAGDAPGTLAPPDDFGDFGDFGAAVAGRYCGRVDYYQVWNEPNIYPEWGEQDVDPEAYTALLRVAYQRITAACPTAVVVSAALAQNTEPGGRNLSDLVFLERMYAAGAGGYFDVLGAQAFGLWTGPTDRRMSRDRTNFSRVALTRAVMVDHGDADKPIWVTEMGWAAVPRDMPTAYGRVTREQQARYVVDAYRRANREWPFVGPLFTWFLRRPDWSEQGQDWFYFGLLSPDWERTAAFDALAALASQPPVIYPGIHQENHPALTYMGAWEAIDDPAASLGGYRAAPAGAALQFDFYGTDVGLQSAGSEQPLLDVRTDTGPPRRVSGRPDAEMRLTEGLPSGRHTAHVAVLDGLLAVDAVVVRDSDMPLVRRFLLAIAALFSALGALILVIYVRRSIASAA